MRKLAGICPAFGVIVIFILFTGAGSANKEYISVQQAVESGAVHLKITGNGSGYSGNCLDMEIKNIQKDSGFYNVEPGRRLKANDTTTQDILVTRSQFIRMAPGEVKHIGIFGFCCQAHNHAPDTKSTYSVGNMADENLISLAVYLNKNSFPLSAVQHAVWAISDNNPVSSIIAGSTDSVQSLRDEVASIKHIENPWYSLTYQEDPASLFSGKYILLTGTLKYYISGNAMVSINVYDMNGMMIKTVKDGAANPDTYNYPLVLDVRGWLKGKYHIKVTSDDNKILEKTFEL